MNNWFKNVIDDKGIGLDEIAQVADLAEKTVKEYYNGRRKIGRNTKLNLKKILDLTEEDIDDNH